MATSSRHRSRFGTFYPSKKFLKVPGEKLKNFSSYSGPTLSMQNVLFSARFCPEPSRAHLLAVCDEEGYLSIVNTRLKPPLINFAKTWLGHHNAVFALEWCSNGRELITVAGDHTAVIWDAETQQKKATFPGHRGSIKTVSACPFDSNKYMTGSRDGAVMIWDTRNRVPDPQTEGISPVDVICPAHLNSQPQTSSSVKSRPGQPRKMAGKRNSTRGMAQGWRERLEPSVCECGQVQGSPASVSACLFHDEFTVVSGATTRTGIRVWDLRKTHKNLSDEPVPCHTFLYPRLGNRQRGYSSFCTDRYRSKLYAACTDSVIYEYSLTNMLSKPTNQLRGADIDSFYVQITSCPVGDFLLSGSSTGTAQIWDLTESRNGWGGTELPTYPVVSLEKETSEVTAVTWSAELDTLVTCGDFFLRTWNMEEKDSQWSTMKVTEFKRDKMERTAEALTKLVVSPVKKLGQNTPPGSPTKMRNSENTLQAEVVLKRKLAFRSPLKPLSLGESSPNIASFRSPRAKKPLIKTENRSKIDSNPFYYRTPTTNLPNMVRERCQKQSMNFEKTPEKSFKPVSEAVSLKKKLTIWSRNKKETEPSKEKLMGKKKKIIGLKDGKSLDSSKRRSMTLHDYFGHLPKI